MVDLHVHSNKSDGTYTPSDLVDYAIEKGLSAFALTDHDCIDGVAEAVNYAKGKNIEVIPGIEFSTDYHNQDIHIVGLYINPYTPGFMKFVSEFQAERDNRNRKMCRKLTEAGMDITYEELISEYPNAIITRAHYARMLVKKGYVKSNAEAFDRYIGDHSSCFVPREKITPHDAVRLIKQSGGIAVLAHPTLYHLGMDKLRALAASLKEVGLDAMETKYTTYTGQEERRMRTMAKELGLMQSGGSDFHGANKPTTDLAVGYGNLYIDDSVLNDLKTLLPKKILFTDLDGTLLNSEKDIDSGNLDAIKEMTDAGHKFVISTGRPLASAIIIAKKYGWMGEGYYISSYNGGLIYDCFNDEVLIRNDVSIKHVQHILEEAHSLGIHAHTYTDTHVVSEHETDALKNYSSIIKVPYVVVDNATKYMKDNNISDNPMKAVAISRGCHEVLDPFRDKIAEKFGDEIYTTFSTPGLLEFAHPDANKGFGVKYLASLFNIPIQNTIACGDEENDAPMIKAAGIGVVMANGSEEMKSIADYITEKDNDHNAIEEVIHKFICPKF